MRYINLLSFFRPKGLANIPYHMNVVGPNISNGPVIPIKKFIKINSELRSGVECLKRTRKQKNSSDTNSTQ